MNLYQVNAFKGKELRVCETLEGTLEGLQAYFQRFVELGLHDRLVITERQQNANERRIRTA